MFGVGFCTCVYDPTFRFFFFNVVLSFLVSFIIPSVLVELIFQVWDDPMNVNERLLIRLFEIVLFLYF